MSDNPVSAWGGFLRIDKQPAENDIIVGNADGTFSFSSSLPDSAIAPGSITSIDLADGAVTTNKMVAGSVVSATLADGAVVTTKIPDNAITTSKIIDQGIITAKLRDGAVTAAKMPDNVITETKIAPGSISTGKIQANAITTNLLAAQAVTADIVAANAIIAGKIAVDAVTAITIKAESIETDKIKIGAVVTDSIANFNVSNTSYVQGANTSSGSPITTPSISLVQDARVSILVTYVGGDNLGLTPTSGTLTALVNGAAFSNNTAGIGPVGSGIGFTTAIISGINVVTSVVQQYNSGNTTLLTFYSVPSSGNYTFSAYASGGFTQLVSLLVMELKR